MEGVSCKSLAVSDDQDLPCLLASVKDAAKSVFIKGLSRKESVKCIPSTPEPVVWDESDSYDTGHSHRGIALVIIIDKFHGHPGRQGSKLDEENLTKTFSSLGFQVRLAQDCSFVDLKAALTSAAKEDHSNSDCFVLAISSHGDQRYTKEKTKNLKKKIRNDVVFCTDSCMTTREIVQNFSDSECPSLKGKPRLFFFQACRGTSLDEGLEIEVIHASEDTVDAPSEEVVISPAPCFKDFLIMCATQPGFYAFRRPTDGSWFIQALCSILEKCDGSKDMLHLLTGVINRVALDFMSRVPKDSSIDQKKQTPVIYSMLTKDLYLNVVEEPGKIFTWL